MSASHYVYYALGFKLDGFSIKAVTNGFVELAVQAYIGVRTGLLPDNCYKTSSTNKQWMYLCKLPLAVFETRAEANEAELELLLACKKTCWEALANRGIYYAGFTYGCKHSAETKRKLGLLSLGNKYACYKHAEAHNKAISNTLLGREFTDGHRAKLSASATGRKHSRQAVLKSQLGHNISTKRAEFEQELYALQTGIACDLLEAPND